MPRVIVFDVNETLLDVSALAPHFERLFGDARVLREWFATVLLYSEVLTLAGPYAPFGAIGGAAVEMMAAARGVTITPGDRTALVTGMLTLPPHPEVIDSLALLRDAGFRLAALSNSAADALTRQLDHADLSPFFEKVLSVGDVQRFKPAPEPYLHAARQLGVEPADMRMVAAHAWDVHGAMRAGCAGAFVARPGQALFPLTPPPDIVGRNVREVTDRILTS